MANPRQPSRQPYNQPSGKIDTPVTAPYNFVPLLKGDPVVFPEWDSEISHDVPFPDGISGKIELTLMAASPLLVALDQKKGTSGPTVARMLEIAGRPVIPGSSLRGMVRSIIEIAAFGRFGPIDDSRLSVRDLHNSDLYTRYFTETVNGGYRPLSRSGWLTRDPSKPSQWLLVPCRHARVEQEDLERLLGGQSDLGSERPPKGSDAPIRSALGKYDTWKRARGADQTVAIREAEQLSHEHSGGKRLVYRRIEPSCLRLGSAHADGWVSATIVFTGQPGTRKRNPDQGKSRGKHMEFAFYAPHRESVNAASPAAIKIDDNVRRDFEFVHGVNTDMTPEWKHWSSQLDEGRPVPVFYLEEQGAVQHMGLCQMFRLPYAHTAAELVRTHFPAHADSLLPRRDLAECIFGRVTKLKPQGGDIDSLRGRATFDMAVATSVMPHDPVDFVLGQPKPSFYPSYTQQPAAGPEGRKLPTNSCYKTWMDGDALPRGWKRYPARKYLADRNKNPDNDKVNTRLHPVGPGTLFRTALRVHNLRPEEMGALLWALTWGGNSHLRHSLGLGKAMGLGLLSIRLDKADLHNVLDGRPTETQVCLKTFEAWMARQVQNWGERHIRIQSLLRLADPDEAEGKRSILRPMNLADKDFTNAKKNKNALPWYTPVPAKALTSSAVPPAARSQPRTRKDVTPPTRRWGIFEDERVEIIGETETEFEVKTKTWSDFVPQSEVKRIP